MTCRLPVVAAGAMTWVRVSLLAGVDGGSANAGGVGDVGGELLFAVVVLARSCGRVKAVNRSCRCRLRVSAVRAEFVVFSSAAFGSAGTAVVTAGALDVSCKRASVVAWVIGAGCSAATDEVRGTSGRGLAGALDVSWAHSADVGEAGVVALTVGGGAFGSSAGVVSHRVGFGGVGVGAD